MPGRKKVARKNKLPLPLLIFASFIGTVGVYLYTSVLPYQFPNQWQPSSENLNTGGKYNPNEEIGVFHGTKVTSYKVPEPEENKKVLGESDAVSKRVEVDLTNQKVYAFEGDNRVLEFLVSTGKWGRTPTGTFTIDYKTRAQSMKGGSKQLGTYYYLPNVQYVQFFGNKDIPWSRGFGFHGTYWHENFGHPMSHGCINMRNEDAQKLYDWTGPDVKDKGAMKASAENSGTKVMIYGTAPNS